MWSSRIPFLTVLSTSRVHGWHTDTKRALDKSIREIRAILVLDFEYAYLVLFSGLLLVGYHAPLFTVQSTSKVRWVHRFKRTLDQKIREIRAVKSTHHKRQHTWT